MHSSPEVRETIAKFPGPVTLVASRAKWWFMTLLALLLTAGGLFMTVAGLRLHDPNIRILIGIGAGIVGTIFFGAGTVMGVTIILNPAASFLRLDKSGFEFSNMTRRGTFTWDQVSDFNIYSGRGSRVVMFRAASLHQSLLKKINTGLTGGRNGFLPDTYGLSADDLIQLMTMWQEMALKP